MKIIISSRKCIGCGICQALYENNFELKNGLARVKSDNLKEINNIEEIQRICPSEAIEIKN